MNRFRTSVALLLAVLAVAFSVGVADARVGVGPPEATASPHTRTDPTGDCTSFAGSGGPRCDLVKIKIVNRSASVKLIATYAGTPYLPQNSPSNVGLLVWNLEGATDRTVWIANNGGGLDVEVRQEPDGGGDAVCWSGNEDLAAPVVDGTRVTVVVPRACLGTLEDVRVFAHTERVKFPSAAVSTDRAPNAGFTARIAVAP